MHSQPKNSRRFKPASRIVRTASTPNYIKIAATIMLSLLFSYSFTLYTNAPVKWVLNKDCSLKVNGSTNVNKFSCVIPNYPKADTLLVQRTNVNESVKITGAMNLDVNAFDCHNPIMTKDLRKTLKSDKFPKLIVKFISLSKYPSPSEKQSLVKGAVTISLAGVTKQFNVDYRCISDASTTLTLIGNKEVNFSDFNIIPPRKLGGMIKTNDELSVEFVLKMTQLN